ncbi:MAG: hypothetical protein JO049_00370 [Hyphomicrobiales bacterium]|nr:hypothetical protein [Hyphomicrobiales bacterium]
MIAAGELSAGRVAHALAKKRLLLVLDNCEHVIDVTAATAEAVLRAAAGVRIIATSREPLRTEGEWLYPVPPLAIPAEDPASRSDPLQYGAVRLFLERARAAEPRFAPDAGALALIASICRRLDGIPLAIELAAARSPALGIERLAAYLDDRFRLLTVGRRTALPRHQTLRAMLDWSHQLLPEHERLVLRRLGVFAGPFALEAPIAVVASAEIERSQISDTLVSLVEKSLVVADASGPVARFRLLDTTRVYALEKLTASGESRAVARRHAEFYRDIFEKAEAQWQARRTTEWLAEYAWHINNLRAALDWTFSPDGEALIGVGLTTDAVPLWMHLSLMDECRSRVEQALVALDAASARDAPREMKLYAALATSLTYTNGTLPEMEAAWEKTLALAELLDDTEYRLRALWELWAFNRVSRWRDAALKEATRFATRLSIRPTLTTGSSASGSSGSRTIILATRRGRAAISKPCSPNTSNPRTGLTSSGFRSIGAPRHARFWRGCFGCRDFRPRRHRQPMPRSRMRAPPITQCRCVTRWCLPPARWP